MAALVTAALLSVLSLLPAATATAARDYVIQDNFVGEGFTTGFFWQNIPDPTSGMVLESLHQWLAHRSLALCVPGRVK